MLCPVVDGTEYQLCINAIKGNMLTDIGTNGTKNFQSEEI